MDLTTTTRVGTLVNPGENAPSAFTTLLGRYRSVEPTADGDWTTYTPLRGRTRLDLRCTR